MSRKNKGTKYVNDVFITDTQFNNIKDAILTSILCSLPDMINDIFPKILVAVKEQINEHLSKTNVTKYEKTRNFKVEVKTFVNNNCQWIETLKKRKDIFYRYKRCDSLTVIQ